jgi:hypothetical protein
VVARGRPEPQAAAWALDLDHVEESVEALHQVIRDVPDVDRPLVDDADEVRAENPIVVLEPPLPHGLRMVAEQQRGELVDGRASRPMLKTSAEIVGHEPLPHEDVEELLSVGIVEDLADDVEAPLVAAVEDEIAARPGRERLDVVGDELD